MSADDMETFENDEKVDQPEGRMEDGFKPGENVGFWGHLAKFMMVVGLSLIGLFIASWVQNVLVHQRVDQFTLQTEQAEALFWRVLASAINLEYLYAIVGIILCLMAIHMVDRTSWYVFLPVFVFFAWINAIVLVLGFLGLAFVLDWKTFWSPYSFSAALLILRFLVETGVFIAIIVVEMPYLRKLFENLRSSNEQEAGLLEE